MERLVESLSTFFEKRVRSPFWAYLVLVLVYHFWQEIYITLFVDEKVLFEETGCSVFSYVLWLNPDNLGFWEITGHIFLAWLAGNMGFSLLGWAQKGWDVLHLSITNRIESEWIVPRMTERLRMQEEYKDVSRFRQERTLFTDEMAKEIREFKKKFEDELDEMRKSNNHRKAWLYEQRIKDTIKSVEQTVFYQTNGVNIDRDSDTKKLLRNEGVIDSRGSMTDYGRDVKEYMKRLKEEAVKGGDKESRDDSQRHNEEKL